MYEIVCPKDQEDVAMGLIKPGKAGGWGKAFKMFTKILGLKKPSTTWKPNLLPNTEGISIMCLGTKDDKLNWGKEPPKDVFQKGHLPKEML